MDVRLLTINLSLNMKSRPLFLRALRLRQAAALQRPLTYRPDVLASPNFQRLRSLSTSTRLLNEKPNPDPNASSSESSNQQSSQSKSKQRQAPPEEDNAPPQSPFKVFAQVLKEEISKNSAWQENVKQLQGDVDKFADSAAMKRAREMYERARITTLIQNNPRIQAAVQDLKRRGVSVSEAINRSLEDSAVIEAIRASYGWASSAAARATQPIRDTPVYKAIAASVEEAFDDVGAGSRYGGYEEREARRKRRELRAAKAGKVSRRMEANPE